MKKKNKTKTQATDTDSKDVILRLPNHIIVEIFCKIPTKKLLQFKAVSKSWLSLLSDPQFTKDLFSQTPSCFITRGIIGDNTHSDLFIVDPEKASSPDSGVSLKLRLPANADPRWMRNIVGSCNGLLCIRHTLYKGRGKRWPNFYTFYLLNPITGETLALPRLKNVRKGEYLCAYGFELSPVSRVYKLVVIMHSASRSDEYKAMVLTIDSKSWRSIGGCKRYHEDPGEPPQQVEMVYLNGSLHWYDYRWSYSMHAFDIESDQFRELQVSTEIDFGRHSLNKLGVLGGCLSLTGFKEDDSDVAVVWVMKDYNDKESWTKDFEIRQPGIRPLKFTEGKLIVQCNIRSFSGKIMAYTPRTRRLESIEVIGMLRGCYSTRLYVPNLVLLKDILCVSSSV